MVRGGTLLAKKSELYDQYLREHREEHLRDLEALMRIKSISPYHEASLPDRWAAAEWLMAKIQLLNPDEVKLIEAIELPEHPKHPPLVWAKWSTPAPNQPTVLVYCHYDVMPAEEKEWTTKPFEPDHDDGVLLRGRGSCDDKGQLWMQLKAIETLLAVDKQVPVNIKVIFEGEEEDGSAWITDYFNKRTEETRCDALVISDTDFFAEGVPAICAGLRGLVGVTGTVIGPNRNLHSGLYGGAVKNPLEALAEIIVALKDKDGVIQVPNFYDDVIGPTPEQRLAWSKLPWSDEKYAKDLGVTALFGEHGYTTLERLWARPTLEINAFTGGNAEGQGITTAIPSEATFKITCRLVPNQDPVKIRDSLIAYLQAVVPEGVRVVATAVDTCAPAVLLDTDQPADTAAVAALKEAFEAKEVFFICSGGSVPVVETMKESTGVSPVLLGFGLPDDNIHGPNEHFKLNQFDRGLRTLCQFWNNMVVR